MVGLLYAAIVGCGVSWDESGRPDEKWCAWNGAGPRHLAQVAPDVSGHLLNSTNIGSGSAAVTVVGENPIEP